MLEFHRVVNIFKIFLSKKKSYTTHTIAPTRLWKPGSLYHTSLNSETQEANQLIKAKLATIMLCSLSPSLRTPSVTFLPFQVKSAEAVQWSTAWQNFRWSMLIYAAKLRCEVYWDCGYITSIFGLLRGRFIDMIHDLQSICRARVHFWIHL